MYNEERKQEFIKFKSSTTEMSKTVFSWFMYAENLERQYGKDVCDFTSQEAITLIKYIGSSKISTSTVLVNTMRIYTDWCLSNSLVADNQNHWYEISTDVLYDCIDYKKLISQYLTKQELDNYTCQMINEADKFIFLSLFEGLNKKEIATLKYQDVNGSVLTLPKRDLLISDELQQIIANTYAEIEWKSYIGKDMSLEVGDEILRPVQGRASMLGSESLVVTRFMSIEKGLGIYKRYSSGDIRESGRFEMIKGIMKENNVSMMDAIGTPYREQIERRYGKIQNYTAYAEIHTRIIKGG